MRWTNWNDHLLNSSVSHLPGMKELSINAWFFGDECKGAPESVTIAVSKMEEL